MRIFTLLQNAYLLMWLISGVKSGVVALILSLFFGFFSETWFFWPAFWGFWLPCLLFSAISSWKERRALQPISDVAAAFSGTASEKQKVRAYKALKEDLDEFEECDLDEGEFDNPISVSENKSEMKRVLMVLLKAGVLKLSSEVKSQIKEYIEDYDLRSDPLCTNHFVQEVLADQSIIWQSEEIFDPQEYYSEVMKKVAANATILEIENISCVFDEDFKSVDLKFDTCKGPQHWFFKHFSRSVSENFIIHLALMLKKEANFTMGLLDTEGEEEEAWAVLLPKQVLNSLSQQGVLSGKEIVL
ncbi:hypothetical protein [Shewanella nanhaiensis]|uniref:Uncharacterized protein n=1 Tax=Shewanella nanhaiensis TaxID=2864872 RepID=A0ABS7E6T4_9GAMM|nr:hypothetical protein [Shewanella nanhaiensis]MBW8185396.1 hypothetical protein [Shewanella nanhaiensis]